jgi:hypothetical protein
MAERKSPESYPRPDYRVPNARIGMTHAESRPDFPAPAKAPRGAPNITASKSP